MTRNMSGRHVPSTQCWTINHGGAPLAWLRSQPSPHFDGGGVAVGWTVSFGANFFFHGFGGEVITREKRVLSNSCSRTTAALPLASPPPALRGHLHYRPNYLCHPNYVFLAVPIPS